MNANATSEQAFVSTRDAAALLGVSVRTVQLWVENGTLHAWKTVGGHRRIARVSVNAVLAQQRAVIETASSLHVRKILLIDDDPVRLARNKELLENLSTPILLTTAQTGYEGLMATGEVEPDVVMITLGLGDIDVLEMIASIANRMPSVSIIVLNPNAQQPLRTDTASLPPQVTTLDSALDSESVASILRLAQHARHKQNP